MYLYIIECADQSLYTGIATDIERRLRQHYFHLSGCAKYTLSHPMKRLRALWHTDDKHLARSLEYRIKQLTRQEKLQLIETPNHISSLLTSPTETNIDPISHKEIESITERIQASKDQ